MRRRDIPKMILSSAAGAVALAEHSAAQSPPTASYPVRTNGEIAGAIVPTDYSFPPGHVHRYGAVGDGVNDDLPAFQAAHKSLGAAGGLLSGLQRRYLFNGTLVVSNPVTIDFGNSYLSYTPGSGAQIVSMTNDPIVKIASSANSVGLRNINIVGMIGKKDQDGVQLASTYPPGGRVYIENVGIFNCGRYGLYVANSYGSSFINIYVQGCGASGIYIDRHCGANRWFNIATVANKSTGFDINSADGSDYIFGLISEQNHFGIVIDAGVTSWAFIGVHTEHNVGGSLLFKAGSNRNRVDFEQWGGGEPAPVNQGGAQNSWSGNGPGSKIYEAKCVQRVSSAVTEVVTGSNLAAMPYATSIPTLAQGLLCMTCRIVPQAPGNKIVCRTSGFAEIGASGVMTAALFNGSACIAAHAKTATAGSPESFSLEYETTAADIAQITFNLYIGSSNARDSVSFAGHRGVSCYGGAQSGSICIEEFRPSSG